MPYDTALTTSLIDAILDNPKYQRHPQMRTEYECAYCLAPVRDGHCEHGERCLVTKAKAVKATYCHDTAVTHEMRVKRLEEKLVEARAFVMKLERRRSPFASDIEEFTHLIQTISDALAGRPDYVPRAHRSKGDADEE